MNYVRGIDLFGVEVSTIPCVVGSTSPDNYQFEEAVHSGMLYLNSSDGKVYYSVLNTAGQVVWVRIGVDKTGKTIDSIATPRTDATFKTCSVSRHTVVPNDDGSMSVQGEFDSRHRYLMHIKGRNDPSAEAAHICCLIEEDNEWSLVEGIAWIKPQYDNCVNIRTITPFEEIVVEYICETDLSVLSGIQSSDPGVVVNLIGGGAATVENRAKGLPVIYGDADNSGSVYDFDLGLINGYINYGYAELVGDVYATLHPDLADTNNDGLLNQEDVSNIENEIDEGFGDEEW